MHSDLNINFSSSFFGVDENADSSRSKVLTLNQNQNEGAVVKLVDKISENLKELGILLKAYAPDKVLNVLVMKQQLNIITPVVQIVEIETSPRNINDILKMPEKIQRRKLKNPNMKISYGVMSSVEVVETMKKRQDEEQKRIEEKEEAEIYKVQRQKEIQELDLKTRADRERLKTLKIENSEINKSNILKRKINGESLKLKGNDLVQRPSGSAKCKKIKTKIKQEPRDS